MLKYKTLPSEYSREEMMTIFSPEPIMGEVYEDLTYVWMRVNELKRQGREEEMKYYIFQCNRCFLISGFASQDPKDAPTCCGGEKMIAIERRTNHD